MSKQVIVYGGRGALGDCLVRYFKKKDFKVTSIDLKENEEADLNITLTTNDDLDNQATSIAEQLKSSLKDQQVDAILNVAGGWAGGNAGDKDFLKNSDLMFKQSVSSSLIAASLASRFLKENGLLTLAGAAAALDATPGMIGYGAAKAATIHIGKSLAGINSGMPKDSTVLTIAPIMLDTPMNRKWMPKVDKSTWTPLEYIAELFDQWIDEPKSRPANGSVVKLTTENGETRQSFH